MLCNSTKQYLVDTAAVGVVCLQKLSTVWGRPYGREMKLGSTLLFLDRKSAFGNTLFGLSLPLYHTHNCMIMTHIMSLPRRRLAAVTLTFLYIVVVVVASSSSNSDGVSSSGSSVSGWQRSPDSQIVFEHVKAHAGLSRAAW